MVILKQESQYASANDHSFSRVSDIDTLFHDYTGLICLTFCRQLNFQMEQGLPLLSKWLIFNRFKFVASKGVKLGPALLVSRWSNFVRLSILFPFPRVMASKFWTILSWQPDRRFHCRGHGSTSGIHNWGYWQCSRLWWGCSWLWKVMPSVEQRIYNAFGMWDSPTLQNFVCVQCMFQVNPFIY